jgi:N-acetylgalactosamine kinase
MTGPKAAPGLRSVQQWANLFRDEGSPAYAGLARIYGAERPLLREKADFVLRALEAFSKCFPAEGAARLRQSIENQILLVRSAGRINLIGMHIDHRGGDVNPIAVRETWCLCQPRDDDLLDCATPDSRLFPRAKFSIREELGTGKISDWDRWTQARAEQRKAAGAAGDWINYVKAAALYLEHIRPTLRGAPSTPLRGMNLLVAGTVPHGAGLSSSSSIVVAVAEALNRINGLQIADRDLVEICGQAEWYVGTRGGCGDHAAIKFGQLGRVSHLGSHPLTVRSVPFPPDMGLVLCNSLIEAKKSSTARDEFNNRIASYEFGLMLLRKRFRDRAPKMERLRDVNPRTLGLSESEVYRMLMALPERMTREEILAALPEQEERARHILGSHAPPARGYPVRGVCAFGIAECIRSKLAAQALRDGDAARFAEIVNISHDGDRVSRASPSGRRVPAGKSISNDLIESRIAALERGDPSAAEAAALWRMPGGYDASLPELDALVDICLATPGVMAARLVGAGLGGAIHAVVHRHCIGEVIRNVARGYYEPRHLEAAAEVYSPVGGAGVFDA